MAGPWITEHEVQMVEDAMRNGWYENAYHYCETFQNEFAAYHDRKYALMTPSCTTAIHLLLAGLGIADNDEVIVPEITWIASTAPTTYQRATPVFCDIEAETWCLSPQSVAERITPNTKAVIVVDLFGNMPSMDELVDLLGQKGIPLIEDAAEALGSVYKGRRAGKFGIASVFSFHRTKTLTTGEGGMLLLDDDELYERCAFLRDHGRRADAPMYYNYEATFKYMPFNVQAALGYAQFQRLDELVGKKREILAHYVEGLRDVPDIQLNPEPEWVTNGVWCPGMVIGEGYGLTKQDAMERLQKLNVPSRPFFYPLSSLPAFGSQADTHQDLNSTAYSIGARGINLPGAMNLEKDQIDFVCEGIKRMLGV